MLVEDRSPSPATDEVREALDRVLASEGFANSPRLARFLTYIVEEQLAGRGSSIKGKIIAADVYDKDLNDDGAALNLVRVEARRLRRGLEEFYAEEGRADAVRIGMQKGGYRPHFKRLKPQVADEPAPALHKPAPPRSVSLPVSPRIALAAGVAMLVLVLVVATVAMRQPSSDTQFTPLVDTAELSALRERSISSVQAVNLAEQTRGFFFPLFDQKRQVIALDAFRHVIDLDPGLASGHAGAAQVLALQAMLSDTPDVRAALIGEAVAMAERATDLDPRDGWAQAAHAWVRAVADDPAGALRRARIAAELAPEDGHVLDLVGLTALVINDANLAAEVADPSRLRKGSGRFAYNNLWGASQLMLGNYTVVIEAFGRAAETGHPVSAPSLFLLATAYQETGDADAARQAIEEMHATWPGFPAQAVAVRFFASAPSTRERVLAAINAYPPAQ